MTAYLLQSLINTAAAKKYNLESFNHFLFHSPAFQNIQSNRNDTQLLIIKKSNA